MFFGMVFDLESYVKTVRKKFFDQSLYSTLNTSFSLNIPLHTKRNVNSTFSKY